MDSAVYCCFVFPAVTEVQTVNINASGDPAELPCGALQLPPYPQQIC